jgi:hypothetical protein
MRKNTLAVCLIGLSTALQIHAQLAITEVQTGENKTNSLGAAGPDWWELSNYGTQDINLTGYSWNDGGHGVQGADTPFDSGGGVVIHAGETIVITESNSAVNGAATFRQWWGTGNVGAGVQIIVSASPNGLSKSGEAVRLWLPGAKATPASDPNDAADLVDRVDVGAELANGIPSFIYDTNNGTFDMFSTNGIGGAFKAATSDDVGSPGIAPGSSRIVITRQPSPASFTIPTNNPISYTIAGYGLPKPRFQWLLNGSPVDTNALGATISFAITNNQSISTFTIPFVQTNAAGTYSVMVSNGVQTVFSSNAVLHVTTAPSAPGITAFSPASLTAYLGQVVTFTVDAFGSPSPTYQWKFNGTNINGQTGLQLQISLSNTNQSGTYSVGITNSAGFTNDSGTLLVIPKPNLRITEVMSSESTNNFTGDTSNDSDWWELSNFGNFPVNLQGYRFDDNHFSFDDANTITNDITIQPGESIVLVENMMPKQFRTWWGPQNLPANLQIITYPKIGFSAIADALTLWNAAATTELDYIDTVSISTATRGVSFGFDPYQSDANYGFLGYAPDGLSVAGNDGAFVAAVGGDVGSPGTVVNLPRFTSITQTNGGFALSWISQSNFAYTVQFKTNLTDAIWTTLTNVTPTTNVWNLVDPATNAQRFYRLILNLGN